MCSLKTKVSKSEKRGLESFSGSECGHRHEPAPVQLSADRSAARSPQVNAAGHAGSACGNARARFPEGVVVVVFDTRAAQTGPLLPVAGGFYCAWLAGEGRSGDAGILSGGSMCVFASDLAPAFPSFFLFLVLRLG